MYAVIGIGYVGLALAVALSKKHKVLGYDIDIERIHELQNNIDRNQLISTKELKQSPIEYTCQLEDLKIANFYFVVVATPAHYEVPDLTMLISASEALGKILKKGDIVVYESTVYPGTTNEVCIPILEKISHLKADKDFYVGYSPERMNPGDKVHELKNIPKIIAANHPKALKKIKRVYNSICGGVHPISSIAAAEAVKVLENTQRDINIAFMNEFAKIMHALNLDVHEIIEGAKTKWSFVPFKPGLVGGHCIPIDPYYLAFKAKRLGVQSDLILTARKTNDGMPQFILQELLKILVQTHTTAKETTIGIFGITYKEDVNDIRNSLSLKLIHELSDYGFVLKVHDPIHTSIKSSHFQLVDMSQMKDLSVVIMSVGHHAYQKMGLFKILKTCAKPYIVLDIPGIFAQQSKKYPQMLYWHL